MNEPIKEKKKKKSHLTVQHVQTEHEVVCVVLGGQVVLQRRAEYSQVLEVPGSQKQKETFSPGRYSDDRGH